MPTKLSYLPRILALRATPLQRLKFHHRFLESTALGWRDLLSLRNLRFLRPVYWSRSSLGIRYKCQRPPRMKLGAKPPTIKDVAKVAGVSTMTVSRVLNRPELVSETTLNRVRTAIRNLDYVANEMARQMGTGRRPCIGILSLNLATTPYAVSITLTIEQVAREHGWRTSIVNTFFSDTSASTLDTLFSLRPEGVLFVMMCRCIVTVRDRLVRAGVVLANCQTTQRGVACYVPDDEQGQYEGVRRLLDKGYRRPICIHLPEGAAATPLRRKGMLRAFREFEIA